MEKKELVKSTLSNISLHLLNPAFSQKTDRFSLQGDIHLQVAINAEETVGKMLSMFSDDLYRQMFKLRLPLMDE